MPGFGLAGYTDYQGLAGEGLSQQPDIIREGSLADLDNPLAVLRQAHGHGIALAIGFRLRGDDRGDLFLDGRLGPKGSQYLDDPGEGAGEELNPVGGGLKGILKRVTGGLHAARFIQVLLSGILKGGLKVPQEGRIGPDPASVGIQINYGLLLHQATASGHLSRVLPSGKIAAFIVTLGRYRCGGCLDGYWFNIPRPGPGIGPFCPMASSIALSGSTGTCEHGLSILKPKEYCSECPICSADPAFP